jgi:hypothetical protein
MKTFLLMTFAVAANAQLAIYAVNGTTQTIVGSSYQFGQVAINTTSNVQFQIFNTGSAPVVINTVTLGGAGFTFEYPLSLPTSIPANSTVAQALKVWVSFTPTSTATFNASLTISSAGGAVSVILYGSGVTAPTLASVSGCSGSGSFNWGSVPMNNAASCTFALQNLNPQAVTVASVVIIGLGFTGPYGITTPLMLQPQQSVTFSVNFTPPGPLPYTGTIAIDTQSYGISGTGQPALLPAPSFGFDSTSYTSGKQGVLTVTLPSPAPIAATGYVNLAFTPSTAVVKDDSQIMFVANSARTIPFSVSAGSTKVLLNGQNSAAFQTGTTEGTIAFTMTTTAALVGSPPVKQFTIGGAPVIIESTIASKQRTGYLDITLVGADNTYSTGAMSFSFFDSSGNAIGGAIGGDFSSSFKTFYSGGSAGSTFKALVSFPVVGSVASIGSVTVTITNAAGPVSTGALTFH